MDFFNICTNEFLKALLGLIVRNPFARNTKRQQNCETFSEYYRRTNEQDFNYAINRSEVT